MVQWLLAQSQARLDGTAQIGRWHHCGFPVCLRQPLQDLDLSPRFSISEEVGLHPHLALAVPWPGGQHQVYRLIH